MKRAGIKLLVVGLTVLGLCAGVVAGMLVSRLPATIAPAGIGDAPMTAMPTPLVEELALSADQQKQMRRIWEDVRSKVQDCFVRASNLQKQRDEEIVKILSEEQKAQFEKIAKRFREVDLTISAEREQIFNEAIHQTRALLTDDQRLKYDRILKARLGRVPATRPVAAAVNELNALMEARAR